MFDLSGKVTRTSDRLIASGGSQDIYTGEWTGQEVALACPRNQSRAGRECFQRQVEIWRTLRHPNILQLLGTASIGDFVYSVSPYMEFGHVTRFLKAHPDANRVLLLCEIASAAEYLHMNGIIHGDLQGMVARPSVILVLPVSKRFLSQRPLLMGHYGGWHLSSWLTAAIFRLRGPRMFGPSGCFLSKSLPTACHSATFQTKHSSPLSFVMDHYPLVRNMLIRGGLVTRCGISLNNAGNVILNRVLQCQIF